MTGIIGRVSFLDVIVPTPEDVRIRDDVEKRREGAQEEGAIAEKIRELNAETPASPADEAARQKKLADAHDALEKIAQGLGHEEIAKAAKARSADTLKKVEDQIKEVNRRIDFFNAHECGAS